MISPLPKTWSLIKDTWGTFLKTWDTVVWITAWIIPATILQELGVLIPLTNANLAMFITVAGGLLAFVIVLWTIMRLYQALLALEAGKTTDTKISATTWALLPSFLLVVVLQGLGTLGATALLIVPGIYVGTRLGFSMFGLFTKGTKGRAALLYSWDLTKERFWAIFGRNMAAIALFILLVLVAMTLALFFVIVIGGSSASEILLSDTDPRGSAWGNVIGSLVEAAFIPLIAIFQLKLFRALEKAS
ncbi:MAG: hypothetical protein RL141_1060 [Candidatus Parcubacteria bacterium]|jgi:hypothetical protein